MKSTMPLRYTAAVGVATLALGLMPFLKKGAIAGGLAPLPLAFASAVASAATALAWGGRRELGRALRTPSALPPLLVTGVLASGIVVLLNAMALQYTSATHRSVFQAAYPMATAVFAWLLLGERLNRAHYGLMAVMACGLYLMSAGNALPRAAAGAWLLAATLPLIGLSDAYAKKRLGAMSPDAMTAGRFVFGALFLLLAVPFIDLPSWRTLAALWPWWAGAGVCTAVGIFAFYRALELREAGITAALVSLAPLVTAAAERWAWDAGLSPLQWMAVALVIAAAAALALRPVGVPGDAKRVK